MILAWLCRFKLTLGLNLINIRTALYATQLRDSKQHFPTWTIRASNLNFSLFIIIILVSRRKQNALKKLFTRVFFTEKMCKF